MKRKQPQQQKWRKEPPPLVHGRKPNLVLAYTPLEWLEPKKKVVVAPPRANRGAGV